MLVLVAIFVLQFIVDILRLPTGKSLFFGIGLPSKMVSYEGKDFPFSIVYPENWSIYETPTGMQGNKEVIVWITPASKSVPHVSIEEKTFNNPLMELVINWRTNKLSDLPGFQERSATIVERSGRQFFVHDFTWQRRNLIGTVTLECREYAFLKNNKGYSIGICAENEQWSQYRDIFQRILDSFAIH